MNITPGLARDEPGRTLLTGKVLHVDVGDGAVVSLSAPDPQDDGSLGWMLRYAPSENISLQAAGVLDSYNYLIHECSQKEAWRRLKIMRAAYQMAAKEMS